MNAENVQPRNKVFDDQALGTFSIDLEGTRWTLYVDLEAFSEAAGAKEGCTPFLSTGSSQDRRKLRGR